MKAVANALPAFTVVVIPQNQRSIGDADAQLSTENKHTSAFQQKVSSLLKAQMFEEVLAVDLLTDPSGNGSCSRRSSERSASPLRSTLTQRGLMFPRQPCAASRVATVLLPSAPRAGVPA